MVEKVLRLDRKGTLRASKVRLLENVHDARQLSVVGSTIGADSYMLNRTALLLSLLFPMDGAKAILFPLLKKFLSCSFLTGLTFQRMTASLCFLALPSKSKT